MSYLQFDKTLMTNLEEALKKEVLRSNRSGAYSCSTILDCNTRKYHGMLVVPVPELDDENHVLLSSLDCTVIQHGAEFNLGLHKYQGDNYSPRGHKYIREYDCQQVPTTLYRVGGVILKRELMFQHFEDRVLIRYTLLDAHSKTTLRLQPWLAFRSVREFTHENPRANRDYQEVKNGIKTCMYPGYPELYMQLNKKAEWVFRPDWYRGVDYPKETERGYASNEDLYVPGYFEFDIKKGESVVFAAGIKECNPAKLKELADYEVNIRTPRDNFYHCLVTAAHQFHFNAANVFPRGDPVLHQTALDGLSAVVVSHALGQSHPDPLQDPAFRLNTGQVGIERCSAVHGAAETAHLGFSRVFVDLQLHGADHKGRRRSGRAVGHSYVKRNSIAQLGAVSNLL